jgi:hypothetical protein
MPRLYFRHEGPAGLIAQAAAEGPGFVPTTDDVVFIAPADDPGVYVQLRVTRRELYYEQGGSLALVSLECAELATRPAGLGPPWVDTPS